MDHHNPLYLNLLRPFLDLVEHPDIEEIMVNAPYHFHKGHIKKEIIVWGVLRDRERHVLPITFPIGKYDNSGQYLLDIFQAIANITNQKFNEKTSPILHATLPHGHRFAGIVGSNVKYNVDDNFGIAFCIRQTKDLNTLIAEGSYKKDTKPIDLDYLNFEEVQPLYSLVPYPPIIDLSRIRKVLSEGKLVIIAGSTGSGKTTLVKHILSLFGERARFILLEDTPEISVASPNRVTLITTRTESHSNVGWVELIDVVKRFTGDVVLVGEISEKNGQVVRQLSSTGHDGAITTLHTGNLSETLREVENYFRRPHESDKAYGSFVKEKIGAIIHLDRKRKCSGEHYEEDIVQFIEKNY